MDEPAKIWYVLGRRGIPTTWEGVLDEVIDWCEKNIGAPGPETWFIEYVYLDKYGTRVVRHIELYDGHTATMLKLALPEVFISTDVIFHRSR